MKTNKIIYLFFLLGLSSCFNMNEWCIKEEERIKNLEYNFKITKLTVRRECTIEGIDSIGNDHTFKFVNIFPLKQLAEPSDILIKDKGTMEFRLVKGKREYIILYNCKKNGEVTKINDFRN